MTPPPAPRYCGLGGAALDRAQAAAELGGDFLVAVALHLAQGDAAKLGAVKAVEQPATLLAT